MRINRTLPISIKNKDLVLSKVDVLCSLGNFSKLRRQCLFSPIIWNDTLASLLGMLDILLVVSVYSFLHPPLCSRRLVCINWINQTPFLPKVQGVPEDIEANIKFHVPPTFPGFRLVVSEFPYQGHSSCRVTVQ